MPFRRRGGGPLVALVALVAAGCGSSSSPSHRPARHRAGDPPVREAPARPVALRVVRTRSLPAAVQLPGLARAGTAVLAAAGLDAADSSVADVVRLSPGRARRVGTLPAAVHDVAATALGPEMYVFGGGSASGPTDAITRVTASGAAKVVGQLPVALSDASAVTIGDTAY